MRRGIAVMFWGHMDGRGSDLWWSWQQCHAYFAATMSREMMAWEASLVKDTYDSVSELDRWAAEMRRVNPRVFDDMARWRREAEENDPAMFEDLDEVDGLDGLGGQ